MRLSSLGSGSKGNGTLVASDSTTLLIDCGFPRREAERRIARRGIAPSNIDAILVTHEHADHAAGVAAISRAHGIPVYLTHGTAATGRITGAHRLHRFNSDDSFVVGDIAVTSVTVPHDAREPVQYRLASGDCGVGVLTDLGSSTSHVVDAFSGCSALLLEFNHELALLQSGPYPASLKRRVAGDFGHLNNQQALDLLEALDSPRLQDVIVAHISEQNNSMERVTAALSAFRGHAAVRFACQSEGFDWISVAASTSPPESLSASA
ncbi:metallo-beta-lactamase family protein [Luminiphilus syltensis NOR5-1B]|uniref:Metallo-beta-lactamase family protein n=1 Tax=Luminiphilus syltensis NOR5-1B TaxID=565045 RepID=B8KQB3_9GAMM|nr:MBL fold metallo-hydrolase [Luminiphilus syltensis]EED36405.1 metallo-beta-lactamase family protein [Luminiphilus syltensis NOR5-1B]